MIPFFIGLLIGAACMFCFMAIIFAARSDKDKR